MLHIIIHTISPNPHLSSIHSYIWGYLSDKYGRRPILLVGVFGSMVSTSLFGLSPSYGWAIAIRTFGGLMNSMNIFYYLHLQIKIMIMCYLYILKVISLLQGVILVILLMLQTGRIIFTHLLSPSPPLPPLPFSPSPPLPLLSSRV